jgi:glucitol operon activator protein
MGFTQSALTLLFVFWVLQTAGAWMQWRHYQQSVAGNRENWTQGYLGVGKSRRKFGFGAVAMVVVSPELRVKKVQVMTGMSIFARFKDVVAFEGMSLESLASSVQGTQTNEQVSRAIQDAIQRIEEVRSKT